MSILDPQDFKDDPAALDRAEGGRRLVVFRGGQPDAKLSSIAQAAQNSRPFGLAAGAFVVPAGFDESLPEDFLREFEGR